MSFYSDPKHHGMYIMQFLRNILRLIAYCLALATFFYAIGEIVVLYVLPISIVPNVEGSGLSTFGLWFFLAVLIIGDIAGLLASVSIWLPNRRNLRTVSVIATILAAFVSIIDNLLAATLNPLGIVKIDVLFIMLCLFYMLYILVNRRTSSVKLYASTPPVTK